MSALLGVEGGREATKRSVRRRAGSVLMVWERRECRRAGREV